MLNSMVLNRISLKLYGAFILCWTLWSLKDKFKVIKENHVMLEAMVLE